MASYLDFDDIKRHLRAEDFDDDDAYIIDLMDMVEQLVLGEIQGLVAGAGTVDTAATTALVGLDTLFTSYTVGDIIKIPNETNRTIATITDDTHLTVTVAFTNTATGQTYEIRPGIPSPIPEDLKHGMKLMVKHYYDNRDSVIIGVGVNKMPYGFEFLVHRYKNWTVA